ncbi:MAG: hypothetical protein CMI16_12480 [Opitutaceae bacterium]|nr:hypothetical protein [Opitutaceae bacterium]
MSSSTTYRHAIDSGDLPCVPLRVTHLNADDDETPTDEESKKKDRAWGWVLGEEGKTYRVRVLRNAFEDPNQSLVDLKKKIPTLSWTHLGELAETLSGSSGREVTAVRILCDKKAWLDEVVGNGATTTDGSFARELGVPSSP